MRPNVAIIAAPIVPKCIGVETERCAQGGEEDADQREGQRQPGSERQRSPAVRACCGGKQYGKERQDTR
jgi:hypothetical protein